MDEPPTKPLLRALVERGEYKTLYLKPKPEQFNKKMLNERGVITSGSFTITAIYLGDHPSLLINVDEISLVKKEKPKPKKHIILSDSEDE